VSVSFTGEDPSVYADDYLREESQIGAVYVPLHGVELEENAAIRYEKYPWIEKFELDGIKPAAVCCIWPQGAQAAGEQKESAPAMDV